MILATWIGTDLKLFHPHRRVRWKTLKSWWIFMVMIRSINIIKGPKTVGKSCGHNKITICYFSATICAMLCKEVRWGVGNSFQRPSHWISQSSCCKCLLEPFSLLLLHVLYGGGNGKRKLYDSLLNEIRTKHSTHDTGKLRKKPPSQIIQTFV